MKVDLEIRNIRNFIATVEMGNITSAAKNLHISQSALSRQINELEKRLNLILLDRSRNGVALTEAGTGFYQRCRELIKAHDDLLSWAYEQRGVIVGALNIGHQHSSSVIAVDIHSSFGNLYPEVTIHNYRMGKKSFIPDLLSGELDAAYIYSHEITSRYKSIRSLQVGMLKCMLLVSQDNPIAQKKSVHLSDLKNEWFILPSKENAPRMEKSVLRRCAAYGFTPRAAGIAYTIADFLTDIVRHDAVAIYPYVPDLETSNRVKFVELEGYPQEFPVCLAWNEGNKNPALSTYITFVKQQARSDYLFEKTE